MEATMDLSVSERPSDFHKEVSALFRRTKADAPQPQLQTRRRLAIRIGWWYLRSAVWMAGLRKNKEDSQMSAK